MTIEFTLTKNQRDFNKLIRNDCSVCFDKLFYTVTGKTIKKSNKETKKLKIIDRKIVDE
jgi:hypothetical protein